MNPRTVVIALVTMMAAVTGYTVMQNISDVSVDPSSSVMSVQGR